jgi:hypothetical protein
LRAEIKDTLDQAASKSVNAKGEQTDKSTGNQKILQDLKMELQAIDDDIERSLKKKL